MKQLILKVQQAFDDAAGTFTEYGLPTVAHIDKYRGQIMNPELFETYNLPAIFYQIRITWEKRGKLYSGVGTIDFHVQQDATWEVSSISTNQAEGLKQIDFLALVRAVLDDLSSEVTGKLQRSTETSVETDITPYDVLSYTISITDNNLNLREKLVLTAGDGNLAITGKLKTDSEDS